MALGCLRPRNPRCFDVHGLQDRCKSYVEQPLLRPSIPEEGWEHRTAPVRMLTCHLGQVGSAWKASGRHHLRVLEVVLSRIERALMAQTVMKAASAGTVYTDFMHVYPKTYTTHKKAMKNRASFSYLRNFSLIVQPTYPTQTRLWVYLLRTETPCHYYATLNSPDKP